MSHEPVYLPPDASLQHMLDVLAPLKRDIVSPGYDAALEALAGQVPMTTHCFPSGSEAFTWIVPQQWVCHEAWLETLDGRRLFSYADHPLHVVSYSLPFEGEVTREELFKHLHTHPKMADAVPFIFKYYQRDWGLCCTREMKDSLTDERYRVVIRTTTAPGELKVGEVIVPGEVPDSFVLCAHLCHPAQGNDDLSGVLVGIEVMRRLIARGRRPRHTIRFLILPETIGSLCWLSRHEDLIPRLIGGVFLEMLGLENPLALQLSFHGATAVDDCGQQALRACDPEGWTGAFRTVIGNDERQFNAPGVRVPMLSLSRVQRPNHPDWPYRFYHSNHDNADAVSVARLEHAADTMMEMLDRVEAMRVPVNLFRGEVFCSRYGLHVDFYKDPKGNKALFDIMYLIDGTRSVAQIARHCDIKEEAVQDLLDRMHEHGLIRWWDEAQSES